LVEILSYLVTRRSMRTPKRRARTRARGSGAHRIVTRETRVVIGVAIVFLAVSVGASGAPIRADRLVVPVSRLPGFNGAAVSVQATTSKRHCATSILEDTPQEAVTEVALFRRERLVECVKETFQTHTAGGVSVALVFGAPRFAMRELARTAEEDTSKGAVDARPAGGVIPRSVMLEGSEPGRVAVDVLFTAAKCMFDVGDAVYGLATQTVRTVPLIGARIVYRRARKACGSQAASARTTSSAIR
jgi:hypothetical protein